MFRANPNQMLFTKWSYTALADSCETVIPDGCRDILIVEEHGAKPLLNFTDLDHGVRTVRLTQGKRITGFRLRPGVTVESLAIHDLEPSVNEVERFILSEFIANTTVSELVEALSGTTRSIKNAARHIGVSPRTLQRRLRSHDLPKPEFWHLLARVRAAAAALPYRVPLVEIANAYDYSDQSHMNREFVRWFGATPAQMRRNSSLLNAVCQPGLGNWTFEQISIK